MVVDDEPGLLRYMRTLLEADSYQVDTALDGEEALQSILREGPPDVVLLDMIMPGMDGLATLGHMKNAARDVKVVMLSCVSDSRKIAEAVRLGAHDYLTKPVDQAALEAVLHSCLGAPQGSDATASIDELGDDLFMLAASPQMMAVREQAARAAHSDIPILVLGESGSGKEILARYIHANSPRSRRTFMKVNCAALPADLLESELFGYEAGAFTGASKAKPGKFELCNGGTILLDEIGEIPPLLQAKLLHVLQDRRFSRLGGRTEIKVDVRVLAATNINVPESLANGKLRQDLYYRLNGLSVKLPPLRERKQEIPLLLKHFMARFAERSACAPLPISSSLVAACNDYSWPGNLRELENFVRRYLVLRDEETAVNELRNGQRFGGTHSPAGHAPAVSSDLKDLVRNQKFEAEATAISQALEQTDWNRKEAAMYLNISYKALLYKMKQYGLHPPAPARRAHMLQK
jgi:two-component system, NtrC family, response regulator AtoC